MYMYIQMYMTCTYMYVLVQVDAILSMVAYPDSIYNTTYLNSQYRWVSMGDRPLNCRMGGGGGGGGGGLP